MGRAITTALVALLTLGAPLAGALGCSGWKAAAEARMACCAKASACPMRAARASHASVQVSQADADACCAASETGEAQPIVPFAPAPPVATLPILPDLDAAPAADRACPPDPSPPPRPAIARHLLLAVFLI